MAQDEAPEPKDEKQILQEKLDQIMAEDDKAAEEIDGWIRDRLQDDEAGELKELTLNTRIRGRLDEVEKLYKDFIQKHPGIAKAHLAYASFLNEQGRPEEGLAQLEKAKDLDPNDPAVWNNLANFYSHSDEMPKVFSYLEKAIELDPEEPVYLHNLAILVYTMRKDAKLYFGTEDEMEIFNRSLDLYRKAVKLDPENFELAADYAQSYYGIRPWRVEEAIKAWNICLEIAKEEPQKQGVYIHLARFNAEGKNFAEARKWLDKVTHPFFAELKAQVLKSVKGKEEDHLQSLGITN